MVAKIKNYILPHFDPMVWVLSNMVEDTTLQQFLLSSNDSFDIYSLTRLG